MSTLGPVRGRPNVHAPADEVDVVRPRRRRRFVALSLVALLAGSFLVAVLSPVKAQDSGVKEIGTLVPMTSTLYPNEPDAPPLPIVPPPMIIDQTHGLGFAVGHIRHFDTGSSDVYLVMYDLLSLKEVDRLVFTDPNNLPQSQDIVDYSIDEQGEQLVVPLKANLIDTCVGTHDAAVISYTKGPDGQRKLVGGTRKLPCSGGTYVVPQQVSRYVDPANPGHQKLYVTGHDSSDQLTRCTVSPFLTGLCDNEGAPLVVQQIDVTTLNGPHPENAVDWEIDLTSSGCGRRDVFFVRRVGDAVLSYCKDTQVGPILVGGTQGYVVEIPLANDAPTTITGSPPIVDPSNKRLRNAFVRRVPALAGSVSPIVDEPSGLLMLVTADKVNGDAVWVYDPAQHRFSGVLTGDFKKPPKDWHHENGDPTAEPTITVSGIDPTTGPTYLWSPDGLLVAPVRRKPLPQGQIYPLTPHGDQSITNVLPVLRKTPDRPARLFVPVAGRGYVVMEDTTTDLPDPPPVNPDQYTTPGLKESDKTVSTHSGSALASGARLLFTGGLNRAVNSKNPGCDNPFPPSAGAAFQRDFQYERQILQAFKDNGHDIGGPCFVDLLLTQGNRDLIFAQSSLAVDSDSGAKGDAAGMAFGQGDFADPADMQRYGQQNPFTPVSCNDEGDTPATANSPSGGLEGATASSQTSCNAGKYIGSSTSSVSLPAAAASSGLAVGSVSSSVSTQPTKDGVLTVAEATAKGVVAGPMSVAAVVAQATTLAHGNTGTAHTEYHRQWCGIAVAGQGSVPGCIDPDDKANAAFIDQLNSVLGSVRISAPPTQTTATDGGYESSVIKDPGTQAGDQAVNDDYSPQAPGMQVVRYDDGIEGRNRQVLQLANVEGESHYAITPKPDSGLLGDTSPPGPTTEDTVAAAPPGPDEVVPGTPGTPGRPPSPGIPAQAGIPFHSTPVLSSRPVLPARGKSIIERVLRTPGEALKEALELIAENPREFLLLMSMWTLLAGPLYLAQRRRSRMRALAGVWARAGTGAGGKLPN